MTRTIELLPLSLPKFIALKISSAKRQGRFWLRHIPVGDLTEDEAIEYADLVRETFMAHWKNAQ